MADPRTIGDAPARAGDAWAGLFFDVQSKCDESLEILGIATASHIFRKEEAVSVQVFACDGSAVGREGDLAAWDSVFFGCNISLPKVGKRDDASMYNESLSAYGCMSLAKPLRVKAGQTVGLAIYTNSLSGLALRYHAPLPLESATESEPMEDRDHLGRRIGRAAVRIVADAQVSCSAAAHDLQRIADTHARAHRHASPSLPCLSSPRAAAACARTTDAPWCERSRSARCPTAMKTCGSELVGLRREARGGSSCCMRRFAPRAIARAMR